MTPLATSVLFVCTGNVCRSPMAEACLRAKLSQIVPEEIELPVIDSAATTKWHDDEPPTSIAIRCAETRGYWMSRMRARSVITADFDRFTWIFAMTRKHRQWLQERKPTDSTAQIMLFSALAPQLGMNDIPDPWGGGSKEYNRCLDSLEIGCDAIAQRIVGHTEAISVLSQQFIT